MIIWWLIKYHSSATSCHTSLWIVDNRDHFLSLLKSWAWSLYQLVSLFQASCSFNGVFQITQISDLIEHSGDFILFTLDLRSVLFLSLWNSPHFQTHGHAIQERKGRSAALNVLLDFFLFLFEYLQNGSFLVLYFVVLGSLEFAELLLNAIVSQ